MTEERLPRIERRLAGLYGTVPAADLAWRLRQRLANRLTSTAVARAEPRHDERDAVLITYGDVIQRPGEAPLATLKRFCDRRLAEAINTVHVLPFCPSSSDGGFAVIDYRRVDGRLGTWADLQAFAADYRLMADLVLNHCSSQSRWFRNYLRGVEPGASYFIEVDPREDLAAVVRPRPWPLLTPFETSRGPRWVWTTFSADQIDLDWSTPEVAFELFDVLLDYVARGVKVVRLDAVAFLWKRLGTACIHLDETHQVVKVLRDLIELAAPDALLLTETNVPHRENVSYFGDGDEAHVVYQFTLAPLLLHALLRGDARALGRWLRDAGEPPPGGTFLNFTASHDGIGLRPLEGVVEPREIDWLVDQVRARGGLCSQRRMPDGSERPYELNATYRDALAEPGDERLGIQRFLCSQAVAASLKGIPAVYFHSFVGGCNWPTGAVRGEPRDINRQRWDAGELAQLLDRPGSSHGAILAAMTALFRARRRHRAFSPLGRQAVVDGDGALLGVQRESPDGRERVLCWHNLTGRPTRLPTGRTAAVLGLAPHRELLAGTPWQRSTGPDRLGPYEVRWLAAP